MAKKNGIQRIIQTARPLYSAYLIAGLRPNGTYVVSVFSEPQGDPPT